MTAQSEELQCIFLNISPVSLKSEYEDKLF